MWTDTNFYLTVLGVFLGILGLYLTIKHRYPGRISLVSEGKLSLFHDIVRSMPGISVAYNGRPIAANLVVFRASLINSGRKDVTPDMVGGPLSLSLPEGFVWLRTNIGNGSIGNNVSCKIENPQRLVFDLGLFRCGEFASFEALAEVPLATDTTKGAASVLDSAIVVSHRIADTRTVERVELPDDPKVKPLWKRSGFIQFCFYLCFCSLGILALKMFLPKPARIEYIISRDNAVLAAEVSPNADGTVTIAPLDDSKKWNADAKAFFTDHNWTATAKPKQSKWTDYVAMGILLALTSILALIDCLDYFRGRRLYAILRPSSPRHYTL